MWLERKSTGLSFYNNLSFCQGTSQDNNGGFNTWVISATYNNSPKRVYFKWIHEAHLLDWSGLLTGTPEATVVPFMNSLPPSCVKNDMFSVGQVDGAVCPPDVKFTRYTVVSISCY